MKALKEMDIKEKRVLVRVDFNVPLQDGKVLDEERILAVLPTIDYLMKQRCTITLISHLGRPRGEVVPELSLEPVAKRLAALLKMELEIKEVRQVRKKFFLRSSPKAVYPEIALIENLRFFAEEEAGDEQFVKELAFLADVFVQEAFACCHRAHASIVGPPRHVPSFAGFLLEKEVKFLSQLLTNPPRPFVVILGGAKVSDKIGVIENLLEKVDTLLIGGAMAYTFLKAKGFLTGDSKVEEDKIEIAKKILRKAGEKIILPRDHIVANKIEETALVLNNKEVDISNNFIGVDIGCCTRHSFARIIKEAKTVFWNGPLGIFEIPKFSNGTLAMAHLIKNVPLSVVGGGETVAAVKKAKIADQITHISTGGGATLEFLEGKILPGIVVLN